MTAAKGVVKRKKIEIDPKEFDGSIYDADGNLIAAKKKKKKKKKKKLSKNPYCTATAKHTGERCGFRVTDPTRTVCKWHGGTRKRGVAHHKTPGTMYSKFYSDDDKEIADKAQSALGTVDKEIELARVYLARAVKGAAESVDDLRLEEIEESDAGIKKKHRRTDWDALILRYSDRIDRLERTRKELLSDTSSDTTLVIVGGLPDNTD